jgi:hypothetical protein
MELRQKWQNGLFSSLNGINGVFKRPFPEAAILIYKDDRSGAFDTQGAVAFLRETEQPVAQRSNCGAYSVWVSRIDPSEGPKLGIRDAASIFAVPIESTTFLSLPVWDLQTVVL